MRTSLWILLAAATAGLVVALYYYLATHQEQSVNRHYFRVMADAAASFNNNLTQVHALDRYSQDLNELASSLYPNYKRLQSRSERNEKSTSEQCDQRTSEQDQRCNCQRSTIEIRDGQLYYSEDCSESGGESSEETDPQNSDESIEEALWRLPLRDLLPESTKDFSQLLLVNRDNQVLAHRTEQQALSIIQTDELAQQIAADLNRDWMQLLADLGNESGTEVNSTRTSLPGFSHYLDIELNPGQFRLYIYPFIIEPDFAYSSANNNNSLFLIGVLPKSDLASKSSKRWNLGLILLCLTGLVFIWVMIRLFLLSEHQPVGTTFYYVTLLSSFCLFAALASLFFASCEARLEESAKARRALQLADRTAEAIQKDLSAVFKDIKDLEKFYRAILTANQEVDYSRFESMLCGAPGMPTHSFVRCISQVEDTEPCLLPSKLSGGDKDRPNYLFRLFSEGFTVKNKVELEEPSSVEKCSAITENVIRDNRHLYYTGEKPLENSLILAFVMDQNGVQLGPQFSFTERNPASGYLDLSHRDYYKKIVNNQAWSTGSIDAPEASSFSRFYIQRLRNVTDGSLGAAIGVPLVVERSQYVLAADIRLPSITRLVDIDPKTHQDMTLMVVNRSSGEVLFHYDDRRVLKENIYATGRDARKIRYAIQIGNDSRKSNKDDGDTLRAIHGHYQGFPGWFVSHKTAIDPWAIVVFFPQELADNYLSNIFFVNLIHFIGVLLVLNVLFWFLWPLAKKFNLKGKLNIPPVVERRKMVLFASVIVFSQVGGYWLGFAFDVQSDNTFARWALPMGLMFLVLLWGGFSCRQACFRSLQRHTRCSETPPQRKKRRYGTVVLALAFALLAVMVNYSMNRVGHKPQSALEWYYGKRAQALANREQEKLQTLAFRQFPQSITVAEQDPYKLLGTDVPHVVGRTPEYAGLKPDDIKYFSQFTQLTDVLRWLDLYIVNPGEPKDYERGGSLLGFALIGVPASLILLCGWVYFCRNILYVRLFGTEDMLCYLNKLRSYSRLNLRSSPDRALVVSEQSIDPESENLKGLDQTQRQGPGSMVKVFETCAQYINLSGASQSSEHKLHGIEVYVRMANEDLAVALCGLEEHLAEPGEREQLLRLIRDVKQLKKDGFISKFTVHCGARMATLLLTASNLQDARTLAPQSMNEDELCAWARCLKDFTVQVPAHSQKKLDKNFLAREIDALPALAFIARELNLPEPRSHVSEQAPSDRHYRWNHLTDRKKNNREWHCVRYILLKAGALYRHYWCACSSAEKLALYHLAHGRRINPSNVQVLESLATQGLVRVYRGRVRIANQSFAYFVRHAEEMDTIKDLIRHGEVGAWENYKVPISLTLLILLLAVAVWSGSSVYMVISSVLGIVGLVGNIIGNVGFIRNNMFE